MRSLVTGIPLRLWKPGPRLLLLLRPLPLCFFFSFLLLFCPIAIPPLPCLSQLLNAMLMPFLLPSASSSKSNPLPLPLLSPPKFLSALTHPPFSPSLSTIFILSLSRLGLLHEASSLFHNLPTLAAQLSPPTPPGPAMPSCALSSKGAEPVLSGKVVRTNARPRSLTQHLHLHSLLINACCRHPSNIPRALSLLEQMVGEEIHPNVITYTTIIWGLCRDGHVPEAAGLFRRMHQLSVLPNLYTYNAMMDGYCKAATPT